MELHEIFQTTGAISGLFCLTFLLFMVKRQLKEYMP